MKYFMPFFIILDNRFPGVIGVPILRIFAICHYNYLQHN